MTSESGTVRTLHRMLAGLLLLGGIGTLAELFLLEHTEDLWQLIPVLLLPLGLVALGALMLKTGPVTVRLMQGVMALFVVSGILGVYLHYKGNAEFELEMYPSMGGFDLIWESLRGATPTLAPGAMTMIGLLGLVYCVGLGKGTESG